MNDKPHEHQTAEANHDAVAIPLFSRTENTQSRSISLESWQTTWLFWSKRAWIYTMMRILGIRVHKPMTLMFYFPSGQGLWPTVFQSSQPTSPNIRHPGFIQKSALVVRVAEAHGWVFWDLSQTANEMEKKLTFFPSHWSGPNCEQTRAMSGNLLRTKRGQPRATSRAAGRDTTVYQKFIPWNFVTKIDVAGTRLQKICVTERGSFELHQLSLRFLSFSYHPVAFAETEVTLRFECRGWLVGPPIADSVWMAREKRKTQAFGGEVLYHFVFQKWWSKVTCPMTWELWW